MEEERLQLKEDYKPKKNKLMLVFFIVTPLLLGLLIALIFMLYSGGGDIFNDPLSQVQPRFIEPVKEFQVNLADAGGRRYLRTQIQLGFNESSLQKELISREAELRSVIIALLRAKTVEDLQEPGGQDALKDEIIDKLNSILIGGEIRTLYFTEFIIQ